MLETIQIKILDKEYNMLKPRAMDVLKVEDSAIDISGNIDMYELQKGILGLVDKKANVNKYVKNIGKKVHGCDLSKLSYKDFCSILPSDGRIDRVGTVTKIIALTGIENCKQIDVMSSIEINDIYMGALSCYEGVEVLNKLVEDFYTFLK